jgi:hypothetical protein
MSNDGFLVGAACVVTPSGNPLGQSASDAFFASINRSPPGTDGVVVSMVSNGANGMSGSSGTLLAIPFQTINSTSAFTAHTGVAYLQPCDSSLYPVRGLDVLAPSVSDAMLLSAAVVLVWTAAFGFRMLRKALDTDEVDKDSE